MDARHTNTDVSPCADCVRAQKRIVQLENQLTQLKSQYEQLRNLLAESRRAGKRQAAPFSRGQPKSDPKKPGRKSGEGYGTKAFRVNPPVIDEVHDAPLPPSCPRCGGRLIESRTDQQYQMEIPRQPICRQFNIHVGSCACCGGRVQGRHPLQTSDALGCCRSQIGPDAQATAVMLNKELGLSQGKISRFFSQVFGIQLSRGGSCQIMLRAAERGQANYESIVQRVQHSEWIVPDETGWRVGGCGFWLHAAVSKEAVAYLVAPERGFCASARLIGEDYAGTLIHDGYASYDRFRQATHQTCLAHLLRRCNELLQVATRGAVAFPRQAKAILQEALQIRDLRECHGISLRGAREKADMLLKQMQKLTRPFKTHPPNERLAAHLYRHSGQLFTFLRFEEIDATNYRAEQAIRPAVVNRKVWGGNRTEAGAGAQSILMTILVTAAKLQRSGLEFISQLLCSPPATRPILLPEAG